MADDAEILDWGGEDDEHYEYRTTNMGDGDDVVSIGGEEDDMMELAAFQSRSLRDNGNEDSPDAVARPLSTESGKATPRRDDSRPQLEQTSPKSLYDSSVPRGTPLRRSQSQSHSLKAPLMHALPPKPAVAPAPSYRDRTQSNPGIIAASVMSSSRRIQEKDGSRRRPNGASKPSASDVLPPHWVIRHSTGKGGEKGEVYYYNIRTDVSQWERPSDDDHNGRASPLDSRETDRPEYQDNRLDSKTARNDSSGDVRSDRQSVSQTIKGRDRPASPTHDLSHDDRHYRPANGGPRRNSFSGQSDRPDFSREPPRGGGPMRAPHGPGPDRGRGMRRNIGPMQDERPHPQRLGGNFGGDVAPHSGQFKDPPPPSGDDALPPSYRRYRSRSPPPIRDRDTNMHRGRNNMASEVDAPGARDSYSRVSNDRPAFQQGGSFQRQAWNPPSNTRRDIEAPQRDFDPPPRRQREPEYTPKTSMGVDAKRRRVDERTADSAHMRRDRSPMHPTGQPSNYIGSLKEGDSFTGRSTPIVMPDRPREGNIDGRSVNSGPYIPSGPRIRNIPHPAVETEYRESIDFGRRQQPPVEPYAYSQHGKQDRPAGRRFDGDRSTYRAGMDRGSDIMDLDLLPRSGGTGPPQSSGSMYSDRMHESDRRNSMDRPPTAPRAMHSKGSMPTSPIVNMPTLPPQGNLVPSSASTFGERNSSPPDGPRGRRQTRFGWRQQPSEDHVGESANGWPVRDASIGREFVVSQTSRRVPSIATHEEPPRIHDRLTPPPPSTSRVSHDAPPFTRRIPSPKLTGANNVPVPPRKGWQTGPDATDRVRFDYHSEPNWEEPARALRRDNSLDRGSRVTPPEDRYKSLHGDVHRRMSLNDRPDVKDQVHPASYNSSHRLGDSEQDTQHSRLPEHDSSSARRSAKRVSRFSKPQEGAAIVAELPRAPREWIPRESVLNAYGGSQPSLVDRGDHNAHSPPLRAAETVRSTPNHPISDSLARQEHSFSKNRTPQERSPFEDRRTSIPPSTAYENLQSRSNDIRDARHDGPRVAQYSPRRSSRTIPPSPSSVTRPLASRLDGPSVISQNTRGDHGRRPGNQDMSARDDRPGNDSADNNSENVHPSRLPMIASGTPVKFDKSASQPNTPMEEPRMTQSPAFRIKRPHSKFADTPQQRNIANDSNRSFDSDTHETRPPPRADVHERPNQLRSNSLLERLNMTTESETTSSSQPSLRDRVEPPLGWKNNDLDRSDESSFNVKDPGGAEDTYVSGYGEGRGRGQSRGRGRSGRPRRGRGRGGFGAIDS